VRRITYLLSLILIFTLPWEDSISTASLGSIARLIGFVVAGFWLATILMEGKLRKPHLFHMLVLLFFLWNFLSLYWSSGTDDTVQRLKTYGQIFLLLLIFWDLFQEQEKLRAGLQAYVLGAYVLVVSTIYNYLAGNVAVQYEGRYSATGVNANDVALILILGMPIGLPIAMELLFSIPRNINGYLQKAVNFIYIPLSIFAIILTGSRTSIIAVIPFTIFMIGTQRIKMERKILISIALVVSILIFLPLVPQAVIHRIGTVGQSIAAADMGGRVTMWRKSIEVLAQHPVLGVGGGAVDRMIGGAVHNTFLSVAAETGIVGLLLFLSILGLVIYEAFKLPRKISTLWLAIFMTWLIGIVSLSWEFRKVTWILLSFMIIESSLWMQAGMEEKEEDKSISLSGVVRQPVASVKSVSNQS
jgi:O-antigen ligase